MGAQISTPNDGYPDYTTVWGNRGMAFTGAASQKIRWDLRVFIFFMLFFHGIDAQIYM
jgi:hypothetical protein